MNYWYSFMLGNSSTILRSSNTGGPEHGPLYYGLLTKNSGPLFKCKSKTSPPSVMEYCMPNNVNFIIQKVI